MNPDSIDKLTAGLFDNVKNMKDAKNYSVDKYEDANKQLAQPAKNPLFKYPAEQIKEYKDDVEDEYDEAEEQVLDKKFEKDKYELLPEVKNPLKNFYNEVINEEALKYLKPEKRKKVVDRKMKNWDNIFDEHFAKLVNKVDRKVSKWLPKYKIFDYIVKSGKKYKVASSKSKMDKSNKSTQAKLKYVDKLIEKANFSEQVVKKFIQKNDMKAKLISEKEIDELIKPFYEKCLIKAFERKIKYTRRG